jgi:hypothetical protein
VALPPAKSLTLTEAVALVKERGDCSEDEARKALHRAGLDGRLEACGSIPLSAHPDPDIRARHPVRKSEDLRPVHWNSNIDWLAGTVGRYSVLIKRTSIEAWLGTEGETESGPTLRNATDPKINDTITQEYDKAKDAEEKPPNVKEIAERVQETLREQGLNASLNRIQDLAGAEEFKKRRWKPGETVQSKKRRQDG